MNVLFSRRTALKSIAISPFLFPLAHGDEKDELKPSQRFVYVGTYTYGSSKGIYVCRLDYDFKRLSIIQTVEGIKNPSFLAITPNQRYLYAVSEVSEYEGKKTGVVYAYRIDQESGKLTYLNEQPSHGRSPCHINVDRTGHWVVVANYSEGTLAMFPIENDGQLGEASDVVQNKGASVNPRRQKGPHAHSVYFDPNNKYVVSADLGIDKIMIYQFDSKNGKLLPNDPAWFKTHQGAGPRHFTFHPNGQYAYVIQELNSTVTAFEYEPDKGILEAIQTLSTLPDGYDGENSCADIHVSPDGKFLYGSNRGHDSIAMFSIDPANGRLTAEGHQSTQGERPRNFAIDPTGSYLLAANQESNNIVPFDIDRKTGDLHVTGKQFEIPNPVCIKFI